MKKEINLNFLPEHLDEDITFPEEFYENTDIIRLEDIHITGKIDYNLSDEIEANIRITGKMILKDAITLEEISKNLDIEIVSILN